MSTALRLDGKRFGRLLVIKRDPNHSPKKTWWHCLCDCGERTIVRGNRLTAGVTKSCGCWQRELSSMRCASREFSHGMASTITGRSWYSMMTRCRNPKWDTYARYGANGVKVCSRIAGSPQALIDLIGERPSKDHSLDRKNSRGHYSCGMCSDCARNDWPMNLRWATTKEQHRNASSNRRITFNGETRCMSEWAELYGIEYGKFRGRIKRGWSMAHALAVP